MSHVTVKSHTTNPKNGNLDDYRCLERFTKDLPRTWHLGQASVGVVYAEKGKVVVQARERHICKVISFFFL